MSLTLAVAAAMGTAVGVFADPSWMSLARWLFGVASLAAFALASRQHRGWALHCVTVAFAAVCALLAAAAEDAARHPPLRTLLEQRLGGFAIEGLDATRNETPVVVEGTLAADAAVTDSGALLRLRVERVWLGPCPEAAPGGALLDENIRERETAGAKHDECLAEKYQLFGSGHVCKTSAGEGCLHRAALLIGGKRSTRPRSLTALPGVKFRCAAVTANRSGCSGRSAVFPACLVTTQPDPGH